MGVPFVQKERPVVYERGGADSIVLALMADAVQPFELSCLDVPVSWYESSTMQALQALPANKEKNLGTVKIIRPERLVEQLRPYLETRDAKLNREFGVHSLEEDQVELQISGNRIILTSKEFVSLVFDPGSEHDLNKRLNHSLDSLFPIPFPYTGGLNYV